MGKAVNSFRKHELAGEVAKNLVAKWKKLVPQSGDRYRLHTSSSTCMTLALMCLYAVCSVSAMVVCNDDFSVQKIQTFKIKPPN